MDGVNATTREATYRGVVYPSLAALCRDLGLNYMTVAQRLHRGWTLTLAVEVPAVPRLPNRAPNSLTPNQSSLKECAVTGAARPGRAGWYPVGRFHRVVGKHAALWGLLASSANARNAMRIVLDLLEAEE